MRILLVTPPLTQLNTPYPATPVLTGYLRREGHDVAQLDLGIELVNRIFSKEGLQKVFDAARLPAENAVCERMMACRHDYERTVDGVMRFLRGEDPTLARRISAGDWMPRGARFEQVDDMEWAFGTMGYQGQASHLARLYLEDLCDFIRATISKHFELIRYAEHLCLYLAELDPLLRELRRPENVLDKMMLEIVDEVMVAHEPEMVGLSVPFPGNLYGAMRCAAHLRKRYATVHVTMGGGYVNTELRQMSDARLFDFIHSLTFDDGEIPLQRLIGWLASGQQNALVRTMMREDGVVKQYNMNDATSVPCGNPDYDGLNMQLYIQTTEMANPMMQLWSHGRWNKMMLAHGCYWARCAFCDTSLDYIGRYAPQKAVDVVDAMERIIAQTGQSGFHFVDEAAPPRLMRDMALEILRRDLTVTWWANIRFEKAFTPDLCRLLARSGCIAVSGGLEVASDRLLELMDKGVTLAQVTRATDALTRSGIMVHAYLMYGFPTETVQETVDALEVVRQLFSQGLIQSAFWHRFAMTVHSQAGCNPGKFKAHRKDDKVNTFANNEVKFASPHKGDLNMLGKGLRNAVYNYMREVGYEVPLSDWFDGRVPQTTHLPTMIEALLSGSDEETIRPDARLLWLGGAVKVTQRTKKQRHGMLMQMYINGKEAELLIPFQLADGVSALLNTMAAEQKTVPFSELDAVVQEAMTGIGDEWYAMQWFWQLREVGLLVI